MGIRGIRVAVILSPRDLAAVDRLGARMNRSRSAVGRCLVRLALREKLAVRAGAEAFELGGEGMGGFGRYHLTGRRPGM
jgi:hypothetical protein